MWVIGSRRSFGPWPLGPIQFLGLVYALVGCRMAHTVVEGRDRLVAALLEVALHQLGEHRAFGVFLPVLEVAEHVRRASDRQRRMRARGERLPGVDQVDGGERE